MYPTKNELPESARAKLGDLLSARLAGAIEECRGKDTAGIFTEVGKAKVDNRSLVSFDEGDVVTVRTGAKPVRFLLVSGWPIGEPIAWRADRDEY